MSFEVNRYADAVRSTLSLDVNTPPYAIIASGLINKVGTLGAYVDSSGNLIVPGGMTVTGATTLTGNITLTGTLIDSTQSLSGAGAVNITTGTTKLTTTGAGQALTLADGTNGQIKRIIHDVDGGSAVLTPTTKTGFSTITFTAVGESATLEFVTTRGWIILALNGAVAA